MLVFSGNYHTLLFALQSEVKQEEFVSFPTYKVFLRTTSPQVLPQGKET